jgi:MFS family permease
VLHHTAGNLGLIMTSSPLAVMAVAPLSGALSDRIGTKSPACLGAAICGLSLFLMSRLSASASSLDVVWRMALFGLGTGIFQSPNNSAAMGNAPRPHLGVASGILVTVRNLGMVLGIATGGAALYAVARAATLQKANLSPAEAAVFLSGLKYAYLIGGILSCTAAVTTFVRSKERKT